MEITINIGNLDKAIKDLEAYKKSLDDNVSKLVSKVTEYGKDEAMLNFSNAHYDGTNDVKVTSKAHGHEGEITADGQAVLFIEFGTGIYHNESETYGRDLGYGYGTYGPKGFQRGWGYFGDPGTDGIQRKSGVVITRGNAANKCMYNAMKGMQRNARRIAREVFK